MGNIANRLLLDARWQRASDRLGITGSLLCAVHCLSLPLLGATSLTLPALFGDDQIHELLAALLLIPAIWTGIAGFKRHRHAAVSVALLLGISFVLVAAFGLPQAMSETVEAMLTLSGGAILIVAHASNHHLCRQCTVCQASIETGDSPAT